MSDERVEIDLREPWDEQEWGLLTDEEREKVRQIDEFYERWRALERDEEVRRRFARMPYHPLRHKILEMEDCDA